MSSTAVSSPPTTSSRSAAIQIGLKAAQHAAEQAHKDLVSETKDAVAMAVSDQRATFGALAWEFLGDGRPWQTLTSSEKAAALDLADAFVGLIEEIADAL